MVVWNQDNGQIHRPGDGRDTGIGLEPIDLFCLWIDRIDVPWKPLVQKGYQEELAHFHSSGCPYDGYGFRFKQGIQLGNQSLHIIFVHAQILLLASCIIYPYRLE
jgi:hypothetical protein